MSINYDNVQFSEPIRLNDWEPPFRAGLYAILFPDQTITPKPFAVVYFGESGNMSERGFASHHKRACWISRSGNVNNLWIATYLMPNSTEEERRIIESRLISKYRPPCND
jgi:hypothetical protein